MLPGRSLLVAAALFLLGAGCRVDATVSIEVEGRGGTVGARFVLDEEAVRTLGLDEEGSEAAGGVQAADLRAAGWTVTEPRRGDGGTVVVEAEKPFGDPAGFARVMDELSGRHGPFANFRLRRDRSLTRIGYALTGEVDLGDAATGFDNAGELPERLRGAGVDPQALADLLAQRAGAGFRLTVVVDLPGGETVRVEAAPGEQAQVRAASTVPERIRPLLLGLAAVLALAALWVAGRRRPDDVAGGP